MPDDLTPAAEAFLGKWADEDWSSECRGLMMRRDLAALLAAVRGEEREACAAAAERMAAHLGLNERTSAGALAVAASLRAKGTAAVCPAPPRWMSTAEKLPKEGEEVLVQLSSGRVTSAVCRDNQHGFWAHDVRDPREEVLAWRPLPPGPPEEGEEEQP